ncbi:hypothetical protein ZEAMMB73_Zm00001d004018 [Zea mays]|uniref:Uncharacterized protein n=1 Tax=Zea mays TaxID=4577 RepID=A0A1D6ECZ2_MAIZE|nr:hypothetical protein ZEAMMB73_Zm00001d004018 [Zea mays]
MAAGRRRQLLPWRLCSSHLWCPTPHPAAPSHGGCKSQFHGCFLNCSRCPTHSPWRPSLSPPLVDADSLSNSLPWLVLPCTTTSRSQGAISMLPSMATPLGALLTLSVAMDDLHSPWSAQAPSSLSSRRRVSYSSQLAHHLSGDMHSSCMSQIIAAASSFAGACPLQQSRRDAVTLEPQRHDLFQLGESSRVVVNPW